MLKIILKDLQVKAHELSGISKKLLKKYSSEFTFSSLSHKYNRANSKLILALSDEPIGVDLEILKAKDEVLLDFFTEKEYDSIGYKTWQNFYILWTAKEAVIKLLKARRDIRKNIFFKKISSYNKANILGKWEKYMIMKMESTVYNRKIKIFILKKDKFLISLALYKD